LHMDGSEVCEDSHMKPVFILRVTILLSAAASLVLSVALFFANNATVDDKLNGIFVGTWVPSILALGGFLIASQRKGS
jgi:hypothetical protein